MNEFESWQNQTKIIGSVTDIKAQLLVFLLLSVGILVLTGIGYFLNERLFQRFFGQANPLVVLVVIIAFGFGLFSVLLSKGWFAIYETSNLKAMFRSSALAGLFGFIAILVDLTFVFPSDINVTFPESLLYYPTMGFLVEILFHVLPLTVLIIFLSSLFRNASRAKLILASILVVSLLEPIAQVSFGFSKPYSLLVMVWLALHVFLINLAQLIIFWRYDFVSMFSFRLVYYLIWHIGWGYFRLDFLF